MKNKIIWIIDAARAKKGKPGELDSFAQCIKDSGAKYYGTLPQ